ncbi:AccI family restriction endonuclease [Thermococcus eurythermalis]|uniref:AccI family restriction endonuclease n=1 Tax=Thermococcus eurythermalis TaxID=1505907 RepID=UPI0009E0729C|nr:AccI family restriction endonuclease [Thermococcus eurythermalis]
MTTRKNNAPKFRNSGFAIRWHQGRWAEEKVYESINSTGTLVALYYGRSGVGPSDKSKVSEYWQEYKSIEKYGKRPDILVFKREVYEDLKNELPEDLTVVPEDDIEDIVKKSLGGIEVEMSMWISSKMPDYGKPITKKNMTLPTIWIKVEDLPGLVQWKEHYNKPIYSVQVFLDQAFMVSFDWVLDTLNNYGVPILNDTKLRELFQREKGKRNGVLSQLWKNKGILLTVQKYGDRPADSSESLKAVLRVAYSSGVKFGVFTKKPQFKAGIIEQSNGQIIPFVKPVGGILKMTEEAEKVFLGCG